MLPSACFRAPSGATFRAVEGPWFRVCGLYVRKRVLPYLVVFGDLFGVFIWSFNGELLGVICGFLKGINWGF